MFSSELYWQLYETVQLSNWPKKPSAMHMDENL